MRVHALTLLCKDEDDKDQRTRVAEVDVKVELPEFSVTQLRSALEQHFNPDRHQIFSRKGLWRGCLFSLPKSTAMTPPNAVTDPVLEVVVLPKEDDGSLTLALAKVQLSVPSLSSCAPFISELPRGRVSAHKPVSALSSALVPVKKAADPSCDGVAHIGGEQNGDVAASSALKTTGQDNKEMCDGQRRRQPPQPAEDKWGLETDVIEMLAVSGPPSGPFERRRLARAALRAGDADRLLLCLGRLEGEDPRGTPGGRADAFDDPAAVSERNLRRKQKPASDIGRENGNDGAPQSLAKEVPMWTPPFPPEEFDNYDHVAVSEGQDFGMNEGSGVGIPPHHKTRRYSSSRRHGKKHAAGQKQSADLLEALRRLLKALGENDSDDDDSKAVTAAVAEDDGVEGRDPCARKLNASGKLCEEGECLDMECESVEDGDDDNDDFAVAAAVLENSCLRSVFRQYMFGVDWRFISAHGPFYLSLLRLLRDILRPTIGPRRRSRRSNQGMNQPNHQGQSRAANEDEGADTEVLASFLLKPSTDCRGLVELLESLCIGIDDLVAIPPESPPPPPPPPPASSASPSVLAHAASPLSPPLPGTPTSISLTSHQTSSLKLAAAAAAAKSMATFQATAEKNFPPTLVPYSTMEPFVTPPWSSSPSTSPPTHAVKVAVQPGLPSMAVMHTAAPAAAPKSLAVAGEIQGSGGTVPPAPVSAAPSTTFIPAGAQWALIPPPPPLPPSPKPASIPPTFSPGVHGGLPAAISPPSMGMGVSPGAPGWKPTPSPPQLPHMPTPMFAPPPFSPATLGGPGSSSQGSTGEGNPWIIAQQREALEHEQGTALDELARSVLALAKTASAIIDLASASVLREGVEGTPTCPRTTFGTSNGRGNGKGKSTADGVPRGGVGAASQEEEVSLDAAETVVMDGGAAGVGGGDDGAGDVMTEALVEKLSKVELYVDAMQDLQFDTMRMEVEVQTDMEMEVDVRSPEGKDKGEGVTPLSKVRAAQQHQKRQRHHFWGIAEVEGPVPSTRQRRLVRELRSLARELPLYWGSTIAVRVDDDRPHLLKAMIAAPEDTPYDSGLFEFDIYCPAQYPAVPPRVNLMTTGGGRVRFSPNLYACGNVCLSLLGTWSGSPEMMWSSNASLLQVLLSLQTFILGAKYPYFNEPGIELDFGHEGAMERARTSPNGGYEVLRPLTVEWAMTEALRCPPRGFETFVREHLWRKKWHILEVMGEWLREAKRPGGLLGHYRDLVASLHNFLKELIRLSGSMGNCRYSPPPSSPLQSRFLVDPDHQWAEYFAARRGLFGPEAGPPSDEEKRARCGGRVSGSGLTRSSGEGSGGGVGECKGGEGISDAPAGSLSLPPREDERGDGGNEGGQNAEKERLLQMGEKLRQRNGHGEDGDEMEEEKGEESLHNPVRGKIWETPAEARERLQFRLRMAERGMDVASASSAAAAAMMSAAGSRRPEVWAVSAEKAARSAGVGALHGKALQAEEAEAGGRPGVTWSTHPQFMKYFKLLQLGIPREEVVARAVRSGVDPSILDHANEEIPLSSQYSIASPSSPLLRVGPDLDSTPVAQLTPSSGTIYTAKPTRALSTRRRTSKTPADPSVDITPTTAAATAVETTMHLVSSPTTQSPDGMALTGACSSGTQPTSVIANETVNAASSDSDRSKNEQELSSSKPVASGEEVSEMVHPSEHPLVLSGRRVWVVSPVVGWASVWSETGQSILTLAGVDLDGKGRGNGENNGERGSESSGVAAAGKGGGLGPGVGKSWKGGKWKGGGSGAKGGAKEESEATGSSKAKMGKDGKGFDPSPSPVVKIQKTFSFPPPTPTAALLLGYQSSPSSAFPSPNNVVPPPSQKFPKGNKYTLPQSVLPPATTNDLVPKTSPAVSLDNFLWQSQPPLVPTGASQVHPSGSGPQAHVGLWPGSVNLSSHPTSDSGGAVLDKPGFSPMGFGKEPGNTGAGSGGGGQSPFAMLQWDIGAGGGMINAEEEAKKTE